ncbi:MULTISPECIES: LolA family protein [Streptomyces]|uniref:LolA family protein n=1 Tax=Streptomyces TaxID=1883 RepID=UPI0004BDA673|nr:MULTISPECIES: sigma-E factor regulatory protein RseB domain-containing protein [Streptomyces]KJY20025.1 membrane protein [Streptomyces sp. NRRL S-104]KOU85263.1 membrane protein [Streptomyces sp. XY58]KOV04466.1 membrane protein [Streptomyces sp. XY37]KOV46051.1 membrane protein [Streptomyces sp. MMG1064]
MAANTKTSRKAARYAVPVAVAGVAAATVAMVPAFANAGGPDLPKVTAQQLIEKVAASDVEQLSGTAKISTDLGLPKIASGLLGGGGVAGGSANPEDKVAQLANGTHTFRVAADGEDRQRLTFLDGKDEYSLIHNGDDVWGYDSKSNEVFHEKASPSDKAGKGAGKEHKTGDRLTASPQKLAEEILAAAGPTTDVSVGETAQVAGRDAYQLVLKPKQAGSTVGSVQIAVDAKNGVPLRVQLLSAQGGKPIVDAGFTKVDFAKPAADTFTFTPPKGAKVTEGADGHGKGDKDGAFKALESFPGLEGLAGGPGGKGDVKVLGEGWATIARIDSGAGKSLKDLENDKNAPKEAKQFLDSLGDKVNGTFGEGRVLSTRLFNVLVTDDGKVYAGAVTKDSLVKAADANK